MTGVSFPDALPVRVEGPGGAWVELFYDFYDAELLGTWDARCRACPGGPWDTLGRDEPNALEMADAYLLACEHLHDVHGPVAS